MARVNDSVNQQIHNSSTNYKMNRPNDSDFSEDDSKPVDRAKSLNIKKKKSKDRFRNMLFNSDSQDMSQPTSSANLIVRKSTQFPPAMQTSTVLQGHRLKPKSHSTLNGTESMSNKFSISSTMSLNDQSQINHESNNNATQTQHNLPNGRETSAHKDGSRLSQQHNDETHLTNSLGPDNDSTLIRTNHGRNSKPTVTFALNQREKTFTYDTASNNDTKAIINEARLQRNSYQNSIENSDSNNFNTSEIGSIQSRNSNLNANTNGKKVVSLRLQFANPSTHQSFRLPQHSNNGPRTPGTEKSSSTSFSSKQKSQSFRNDFSNGFVSRKLTAKLNYFAPNLSQKGDEKFELVISRMHSSNQPSVGNFANQQPLHSNSKFLFDVTNNNHETNSQQPYPEISFSPVSTINQKNPIADNRFQDLLKIVKPPYLLEEVKDVNRIIEKNDALKSANHLDLDSREKMLKSKEKGYKLAVKAKQLIESGEYEV